MTSWTLYECNQQEKFSSESKTIDLRTSVDIKHLHVTVKKSCYAFLIVQAILSIDDELVWTITKPMLLLSPPQLQ